MTHATFSCAAALLLALGIAVAAEPSGPAAPEFAHEPAFFGLPGLAANSVTSGEWKLVEVEADGHRELFHLVPDPTCTNNVANQQPARVNRMSVLLNAWRTTNQIARSPALPRSEVLPPYVVRPDPTGAILLHARAAEVHGTMVRYEPQTNKNTIGYWVNASDTVSWPVHVPKAAEYEMHILQGCAPGSGGSVVDFIVAGQTNRVTVIETKGFQDFIERKIGTVRFKEAGRFDLQVRPTQKPGVAVMDLRLVRLVPVSH